MSINYTSADTEVKDTFTSLTLEKGKIHLFYVKMVSHEILEHPAEVVGQNQKFENSNDKYTSMKYRHK